jgi:hypothetical protein
MADPADLYKQGLISGQAAAKHLKPFNPMQPGYSNPGGYENAQAAINPGRAAEPEHITAIASRHDNGTVAMGVIHSDANANLARMLGVPQSALYDKVQSGFLTSNGRFVNRDEALKIANQADQLQSPQQSGFFDSYNLKPLTE